MVHQHSTKLASRDGKEVDAVVPVDRSRREELDIQLVHQLGRLQCVPGTLVPKVVCGQAA